MYNYGSISGSICVNKAVNTDINCNYTGKDN